MAGHCANGTTYRGNDGKTSFQDLSGQGEPAAERAAYYTFSVVIVGGPCGSSQVIEEERSPFQTSSESLAI